MLLVTAAGPGLGQSCSPGSKRQLSYLLCTIRCTSPEPETGTDAARQSPRITNLLRNALEFALYDLYWKTMLQILRLIRSHHEYAIL